ncbi:MAG: YbgA family protein [Candidatus Hodarchaeales archaeon]|jgi:uncharacterized protein YbgA (DUF1722 family)/uncharacterized protein YbbK (DUF523 family)
MKEKIKIGISSCLLGELVRYDGSHRHDHYLTDTIGQFVEWVPVCPEVEYGLPVPREAMRLVGDPASPRLVMRRSGIDHTGGMLKWVRKKLKELGIEELCGFIFKSRSPSSGIRGVKVYTSSGIPGRRGAGLFGGAFVKQFPMIPAEEDERLHDPLLRENFIERVFVLKRWYDFLEEGSSMRNIIAFHTKHKLLIMAHSPKHYTTLGHLVAKGRARKRLPEEYITILMEGLKMLATVKKNTNVLMHCMGYFRKKISAYEKQELLEVINNYHNGLIPLVVPITLINHYVRKYSEPYLKDQYYLNSHPVELMFRNHV